MKAVNKTRLFAIVGTLVMALSVAVTPGVSQAQDTQPLLPPTVEPKLDKSKLTTQDINRPAAPTEPSVVAIIAGNPITINVSSDGGQQVFFAGDGGGQFFSPSSQVGSYGVFIDVGGKVYGRSGSAMNDYVPFTFISQSPLSGQGTVANPFKVTTVWTASALQIEQAVSYVNGRPYYRQDWHVRNTSAAPVSYRLFHGGDMYLRGSDQGYGYFDPSVGAVGGQNQARDWYILLQPISPAASAFMEDRYDVIWDQIGSSNQPGPGLLNTVETDIYQDNGAALQWNRTLAANAEETISSFTTFGTVATSVDNEQILVLRKRPLRTLGTQGGENGYIVSIQNNRDTTVTLRMISDTLPVGFSYIADSTTGLTTANPTVEDRVLTWSGAFVLPPRSTALLNFRVTLANNLASGIYYNSIAGFADNVYVAPAINAAPIIVPPPTIATAPVIGADNGSPTPDGSGGSDISIPRSGRTPITVTATVLCPDPPASRPSLVVVAHNNKTFVMVEIPAGSNRYQAVIPAADVGNGPIQIVATCNAQPIPNTVGTVRLYDPSGIVTDAATGRPIPNAVVRLFKLPGALPDTDAQTRDCRTVETRPGGVGGSWSSVPAAAETGVPGDPLFTPAEMDPPVNPQATNAQGRYGWNVAQGCWYVVVSAVGYQSQVSALVGVPPEVTDLNIQLRRASHSLFVPSVLDLTGL